MEPHIPVRCLMVYHALLGDYGYTPYSSSTGWWRVEDVVARVGHASASARKLDELWRLFPALVEKRHQNNGSRRWIEYRAVLRAPVQGLLMNVPAERP